MTPPTIPPTLAELLQLGQDVVNKQQAANQEIAEQRNSPINQMRAALQRYLADRLGESGNRVTAEILRDVDSIYDIPGIPTSLTAYLGYNVVYDLQEALGRRVDRICTRCSNSFEIVEPRKIGGYKTVYEQHCPRCRRMVSEQGKQVRQREIQQAERSIMHAVDVDARLRTTADPTALPHYRARMLAFLRFWQSSEWRKENHPLPYNPRFAGCMICGGEETYPFVTRQIQISQGSLFAALMQQKQIDPLPRLAAEYGHPCTPLESFHQALWRLSPTTYFNYFPEYPLLGRPLLMLCDACGRTTAATHQRCDVSDVREPLDPLKDVREHW